MVRSLSRFYLRTTTPMSTCPAAINIPLKSLDAASVSVLDREGPVVVYCYDTNETCRHGPRRGSKSSALRRCTTTSRALPTLFGLLVGRMVDPKRSWSWAKPRLHRSHSARSGAIQRSASR